MNSYKIEQFCSGSSEEHFITRFGGQPDWITTPQWPVSLAWNKRPLKFIGQVRLNDFFDDLESLTLVYIFMTQPEDIAFLSGTKSGSDCSFTERPQIVITFTETHTSAGITLCTITTSCRKRRNAPRRNGMLF